MSKTTSRDKNGLHTESSHAARASARPSDSRSADIARLAYAKAEARGFAPGHEMDDWLEAEAELDGESREPFEHPFEPHRASRPAATRGAAHRR